MNFKLYIPLLLFTSVFGFSQIEITTSQESNDSLHYLPELTSHSDFELLESKPLSAKFGSIASVKIVQDLKTKQIYYMQSEKYKLHYYFCKHVLGYANMQKIFELESYKKTSARKYALANLHYFKTLNKYAVEFSTIEQLSDQSMQLFELIMKTIGFTDQVYFFPATNIHKEYISRDSTIKIITADEIYKNLTFQALNTGETVGYLKIVDAQNFNAAEIKASDIVLFNGTPNDIPALAGLITTDFQTPLSHINVLCHNRKTPAMAIRLAEKDTTISSLKGKLIRFAVNDFGFEIRLAESDSLLIRKKKKEVIRLKIDDKVAGLFILPQMHHGAVHMIGGKASNFGELQRIVQKDSSRIPIPEKGFAIPFYYYTQHLFNNNLEKAVADLLEEYKRNPSNQEIKRALKGLRKKIKQAPINPTLIRKIHEKVVNDSISHRLKFRSSTNAEDIPGFNGAGLYDSYAGLMNDSVKTYERAIKKVWASLWNYRAFIEREYFGIDHSTTAMGILVHKSFPDEYCNGVAITSNIYRPEMGGAVVNVQLGEVSIVRPPVGVECDQLILLNSWRYHVSNNVAEYINYSSLNNGSPILNKDQIGKLAKALDAIKHHYYYNVSGYWKDLRYNDFALDIEFKFDKDQKLVIKQVRPFN